MINDRTIRFPAIAIYSGLLLTSLGVAYVVANHGLLFGLALLMGCVGFVLAGVILKDYRIGFYFVFFMGVFMFYIDRIIHIEFPMGTIYDALIGLVVIALFLEKKHHDWTHFKNPLTLVFVIIIVYQVLQLLNPSATSAFAWLVSLRNNTSFLLYVICFQLFSSIKEVKRFTAAWMIVALVVALYGVFQHHFGLLDFENAWLHASPERVDLYIIWGELRVFSFLTDPSAFGLFTAASGLAAMVLAMGPFKAGVRFAFGLLMIICFVSMSYSGTRTGMALVAVGIAFYIIIMLHNRRTLIAASVLVAFGVVLFFGPFYGSTMHRLRSTFNASEDPSMAVRDYKRLRFQEYIQTHPIGGGLNTVGIIGNRYSPGHELAGQWDPDSGYLHTALETGWIGLILFQTLFFLVLLTGINHFFAMDDPVLRTYILVYIVPFMALSVAHFTQDALYAKPINIIAFATYALVFKIPSLQKKLFSVDLV